MLSLEQVKSKSAARLNGLHPVVKQAAELLIERCHARGVSIVITQGLRTIAEQNALYEQGRTKPGAIVTNAKGGHSFHNFGLAIDFALLMPDGKNVSWDMRRDGDFDHTIDWLEVVEEAKKIGFEWGGDWKTFKDYPHFEMVFGLTCAQLRKGAKPAQSKVDTALKKIQSLRKEEATVSKERDIHSVSSWAAAAWEEMKKNGYVDGSRPGAAITREETAVIFNRMRKNFLQLIAGNSEHLADLEKRLQAIETGK
ncbi:M15 family metallopeptidase [Paenibacillus lactis]|uniref:M15 family metallopeptidase n=1 Tax=Paenibacillus lactis TaxID=228574 RepID=UPI003D7083D4